MLVSHVSRGTPQSGQNSAVQRKAIAIPSSQFADLLEQGVITGERLYDETASLLAVSIVPEGPCVERLQTEDFKGQLRAHTLLAYGAVARAVGSRAVKTYIQIIAGKLYLCNAGGFLHPGILRTG